ncbi:Predicted nucleic acid-binding protein, contains PIN domain [Variovorax sp. HW608]|uniref:type II toxin-antitoxin system VapC family toxin n=1 Tax=Variovorax sp. HW608 TaxID=1034889 RepID=UPI00081F7BCF|nr:type II toxin-antitoxin system VapC family toxin [Variovorax sp. HW608]SCK20278.1 Predicted nucleic acid-binding protein, contains PIN domain [Variovorax sp. HW608]
MKVLIDSNALIALLDPRVPKSLADRMKGLLEDIDKSNGKLIIPAQVVGEYIAGAGPAGQPILTGLVKNRRIEVVSFDHVAATECALMDRAAQATGNKRAPLARDAIWQKVKVDRQIVAIAKVHGVDVIVSTDGDIPKLAQAVNIRSVPVRDLPLPVWAQQLHIDGIAEVALEAPPKTAVSAPRRMNLGRKSPPTPGGV